MTSLITNNGVELTDFNEINNEVLRFYNTLYSSKEDTIEDVNLDIILDQSTPKLTDEAANDLEGPLTFQEAGIVLKKNAK